MKLAAVLVSVLLAVCLWRQVLALLGVSVIVVLTLGCVYAHALITRSPT